MSIFLEALRAHDITAVSEIPLDAGPDPRFHQPFVNDSGELFLSEPRHDQAASLVRLLREIYPANPFYRRRLEEAGIDPAKLASREMLNENASDVWSVLAAIPFTTKADLLRDQEENPPYGTNLTYPIERYVRHHQTSGTTGKPLRWLDTEESWKWFVDCWKLLLTSAGSTAEDRYFFPFSFGPFIGFWGGFEAARGLGNFTVPGGGMSTVARLDAILLHGITMVGCTPTYALHMAEVAAERGIDLAASKVRGLFVAGEPGGSIPATRQRIEEAWGARVYDHSGMTETGAYALELDGEPGNLRLIETASIFEIIEPGGVRAVDPGERGELVITTLGRTGSPVLRYRTGDAVVVRPGNLELPEADPRAWSILAGGVLGRVDDLVFVRGNNVYPSAVESVVRRFNEVAEYRVVVLESVGLADLRLELEPIPACESPADLAVRVRDAIRDTLYFRVDAQVVPPGSLPRFELKARRWIRETDASG